MQRCDPGAWSRSFPARRLRDQQPAKGNVVHHLFLRTLRPNATANSNVHEGAEFVSF